MTEHNISGVSEIAAVQSHADAKIKRGPEIWTYIYTVLGFALAIEATVITMITPLTFPCNLIVWLVALAGTIRLFLYNGRVHGWLIGWKTDYENRFH